MLKTKKKKITKLISFFLVMILLFLVSYPELDNKINANASWSSVSDFENYALNNWTKPIQAYYEDPNIGSRYFGANRSGTDRKHAANDYVCAVGTPVYAMTGGYVEEFSGNFYAGTQAISVKNDDGSVARYCEISTSLRSGDRVEKGQQIATVIANTSSAKSHMLHLELYLGTASGSLTNTSNTTYWYVEAKKFCRRQDLLDPTFLQRLGSDPIPNDEELGINYPRPSGSPYLSSGSRGSGVSWLQTALNKANNAGLAVDGIFGSGTKQAVINFQNAYGLAADGIAGVNTINKLVEVLRNGSNASPQLETPTISFDKSSYFVGDTVYISWTASPNDSNLSHYWLNLIAPDGTWIYGGTMNKDTSYSFIAEQSGEYSITTYATPIGSKEGEGSLTDTKTVSVKKKDITYDLSLSENDIELTPDQNATVVLTINGEVTNGGLIDWDMSQCDNIVAIDYTDAKKSSSCAIITYEIKPLSVGSGNCRFFVTLDDKTIGSVTLNITVKANQCHIKLYDDDEYLAEYTVPSGKELDEFILPTMSKSGYQFKGWYTEKNGGEEYKIGSVIPNIENLNLYTHWEKTEIKGDINADDEFNTADIIMLQKWLLQGEIELANWKAADINEDGMLNIFDFCLMKQMLINR
ncbi:MAG: peptidoglycan DD-metalloendopeptidase family protein [Ruminococcus sp.]|nr:peptidoglycan DD-metalloendopeptidase family protein [Ruminococcus sp.]